MRTAGFPSDSPVGCCSAPEPDKGCQSHRGTEADGSASDSVRQHRVPMPTMYSFRRKDVCSAGGACLGKGRR